VTAFNVLNEHSLKNRVLTPVMHMAVPKLCRNSAPQPISPLSPHHTSSFSLHILVLIAHPRSHYTSSFSLHILVLIAHPRSHCTSSFSLHILVLIAHPRSHCTSSFSSSLQILVLIFIAHPHPHCTFSFSLDILILNENPHILDFLAVLDIRGHPGNIQAPSRLWLHDF